MQKAIILLAALALALAPQVRADEYLGEMWGTTAAYPEYSPIRKFPTPDKSN